MKRWWVLLAALLGYGALSAFRSRPTGPATVIYDGACSLCRGTVARLKRWDTAGVLRYQDGRDEAAMAARFPALACDPALAGDPAITGDPILREMRLVFPDGSALGGFDAVRALSAMLRPLGWLAPVLFLPGARPLGGAVYRFIAAHRPQTFACTDASCPVHHPSL